MAERLDILLVEDDPTHREVLALHLSAEGFRVLACGDGEEALRLLGERRPDIAVLDVMLPGRSGIELCALLRARHDPSPGILFVTARGDEVDVILGLEVGADDYVIKPARPREVVARVRALARRMGRPAASAAAAVAASTAAAAPAPPPDRCGHGPIQIQPASRRVTVNGREIRLTPMEFALLSHLVSHPDQVLTRAQLLQAIWDSQHEGYQRNVDCHITRLRRKLEAAGLRPAPIETVHGVGYRLLPA
jgi:DNA-binding response OmpR family regulator